MLLLTFANFFAFLVIGSTQTSEVLYATSGDGIGPTFTSKLTNISFPSSYSSIHDVDFRNLRFPAVPNTGQTFSREVVFKNGIFEYSMPGIHYSEHLTATYIFAKNFALIIYKWFSYGGSSNQGAKALVFAISDNHLRCMQEIRWDIHFETNKPFDSFDLKSKTLVVRSAHYLPGDAHCCVSAMDVVYFHWRDSRFIQTTVEADLTNYGKLQSKTLPVRSH